MTRDELIAKRDELNKKYTKEKYEQLTFIPDEILEYLWEFTKYSVNLPDNEFFEAGKEFVLDCRK